MALRSLNNPIASFIDYLAKTGTDASVPYVAPAGLTATGGVISDYVDGSDVYRAHIFTSSGTFDVTAPGDFGDTVEYLVVAGGGGGGSYRASDVSGGFGGGGTGRGTPSGPGGTSGIVNTGGGGGGGGDNGSPTQDGGTGIVIIAYPS